MKKKYISTAIALAGLGLCSTLAFTLTSCASSNPSTAIKVKELNMDLYTGDPETHKINIKDLTTEVNIDPIDLADGTNSYNGGKYMFIYGTVGRSDIHLTNSSSSSAPGQIVHSTQGTTSEFYKWLTSMPPEANAVDPQYSETNYYTSFDIHNTFLNAWFNDNPDNHSPYQNVKILTYIDIPPVLEFNPNATGSEDLENIQMADPFQTWNQDDILTMYNWQCYKDTQQTPGLTFEELPYNWKLMADTYIRQDESAVQYRRLVEHIQKDRPQITAVSGSDNKNSGVVALNTTSKSPFTGALTEEAIGTLGKSGGGTLLTEAGSSWKDLYYMYNGKTWEQDEQDKNKQDQEEAENKPEGDPAPSN